jgi:ubiquinone/menaquinone biosynthesis C-methylase UbiE
MTTPRPNAYASEMGGKYVEAMKVICPQHEEAERILKKEIESRVRNSMVGNSRPRTLLDLGCGGAEFIGELNDHLGFEGLKLKFTGIDSSPVMIEKAVERVRGSYQAYPNSHIRIVQADMREYLKAMILTGQTADIVTSNFVLHNFTKKERKEIIPLIYQVTSPGGFFYMEDKIAHSDPALHRRTYARQLNLVRSLAEHGMPELVEPWLAHYREDNDPSRRMVECDLKTQLWKVGFNSVITHYREKMEAIVEARK